MSPGGGIPPAGPLAALTAHPAKPGAPPLCAVLAGGVSSPYSSNGIKLGVIIARVQGNVKGKNLGINDCLIKISLHWRERILCPKVARDGQEREESREIERFRESMSAPEPAKANEQRGRTEPASPGLVTAKSGRTITSGAFADTRVTPVDNARGT